MGKMHKTQRVSSAEIGKTVKARGLGRAAVRRRTSSFDGSGENRKERCIIYGIESNSQ